MFEANEPEQTLWEKAKTEIKSKIVKAKTQCEC